MAKTIDQNGTESGVKRQKAHSPSHAEQAARAVIEQSVIEQSCGRALSDGEWARRRLLEFVLTLARWDRERQLRTEASRQAEEEVCTATH